MKTSVMFVKGVNDETFFAAHEKQLKALIPEGFVLPNWEPTPGCFFWNLQKETKNYILYDLHVHLHKKGDEEHDYILHYPSGVMKIKPCLEGYHCL